MNIYGVQNKVERTEINRFFIRIIIFLRSLNFCRISFDTMRSEKMQRYYLLN